MSGNRRRVPRLPVCRPRVEGDREAEILDATLSLLATTGYDRLTMDAVASAAKASKATLYRRWNTKAELVIDAVVRAKGAPQVVADDTGSLRGDLLATACDSGGLNDSSTVAVLAGIITALHHDQEFSDLFHQRLVEPGTALTRTIFERARERGEIDADVDIDLLTPVLASIILHRSFVLRLPTDDATVEQIIDQIIIPAAHYRHTAKPDDFAEKRTP